MYLWHCNNRIVVYAVLADIFTLILSYIFCMKKLSLILALLIFVQPAFCACPCNYSYKSGMVNSNANRPVIEETDEYYILIKGNVIKIAFESKFASECSNVGDEICFYLSKDIYDNCGNIVLPVGTRFVGCIRAITSQKKLNKNARVYINLNKLVLPCGQELELKAKPFNKDFALVENGWMTAGKLAASTVGLGAIGTGAGVGLAFIPRPHKIAIGAGTGVAVGCFIGLVTGLLTPGLKYHARKDEEIKVIMCEDLYVPKDLVKDF